MKTLRHEDRIVVISAKNEIVEPSSKPIQVCCVLTNVLKKA